MLVGMLNGNWVMSVGILSYQVAWGVYVILIKMGSTLIIVGFYNNRRCGYKKLLRINVGTTKTEQQSLKYMKIGGRKLPKSSAIRFDQNLKKSQNQLKFIESVCR